MCANIGKFACEYVHVVDMFIAQTFIYDVD